MTATVDDQKQLTLPEAQPGEIFEIQAQGDGRFLLTRLQEQRTKRTPEEIRKALDNWTAKGDMTWEELRAWTREP